MAATAPCCRRSAATARNTPSNSKSVFGPATWMRGLIKPPQGQAIAYLDYIAGEHIAALSGDGT